MIVENKPHLLYDRLFKTWICATREFYPIVFIGQTPKEAYDYFITYKEKIMQEQLDFIHEHPEFLQ